MTLQDKLLKVWWYKQWACADGIPGPECKHTKSRLKSLLKSERLIFWKDGDLWCIRTPNNHEAMIVNESFVYAAATALLHYWGIITIGEES
jgi:hypothetical protein